MLSVDWTAVSVFVAVCVFLSDRRQKRRAIRASSLVVIEFLAQDLIRLARASREMGMYAASTAEVPARGDSRDDAYLTREAEKLSISSLERHATELPAVPPALIEAAAECLGHILQLQQVVELHTADGPVGRHYLSYRDGRHAVIQSAAALMRKAEDGLELIEKVRRSRIRK